MSIYNRVRYYDRLRAEQEEEEDEKPPPGSMSMGEYFGWLLFREALKYAEKAIHAHAFAGAKPANPLAAMMADLRRQRQRAKADQAARAHVDVLAGLAGVKAPKSKPPPPAPDPKRLAAAKVLGVRHDATAAEVRAAYRRAVCELRPDLVRADRGEQRRVTDRLAALQAARDTLLGRR